MDGCSKTAAEALLHDFCFSFVLSIFDLLLSFFLIAQHMTSKLLTIGTDHPLHSFPMLGRCSRALLLYLPFLLDFHLSSIAPKAIGAAFCLEYGLLKYL